MRHVRSFSILGIKVRTTGGNLHAKGDYVAGNQRDKRDVRFLQGASNAVIFVLRIKI
jgi:hypothetical protein